MIRKQLLITDAQNRRLKALASATARSEGDLVREAVEEWLVRKETERRDWQDAWQSACGMWSGREDLDTLEAERRRRRRQRRERVDALISGSGKSR